MDTTLVNILATLLSFIIGTGGVCLIKFLLNKIGSDKLKGYYEFAKTIVMSIEQISPEFDNIDKKDLAVSKLIELSKNKLTEQEADILIEAAVYEVKKILKEYKSLFK